MTLHDRAKALARNRFQQLPQNRMLVAHAKLHSSSLDNRKVTATAWRCLACSRDQSTHSPDSPARKRESRATAPSLALAPRFRGGDEAMDIQSRTSWISIRG